MGSSAPEKPNQPPAQGQVAGDGRALRRPVALLDFIAKLDALEVSDDLVLGVIETVESGINLDTIFDTKAGAIVEETAEEEEAAPPELKAAKPLPVYRLGDGSRVYFGADGTPVGPPVHHIFVSNIKHKKCFGCEVQGDEMSGEVYPRFRQGDILVFSPEPKVESGDYVFIKSRQRDEFSQIFFGREDMVRLRPINPEYPERSIRRFEIKVICRLVGRYETF